MTTTAEEFKAAGNTAFQAGDFKAAIDHYTRAIDLDGTNHVYYSNRSAAYFKQYYAATSCTDDRSSHDSYIDLCKAAKDAKSCLDINPQFVKGYSRKGAALHGLKRYDDSIAAYTQGLEKDPSSDDGLKQSIANATNEKNAVANFSANLSPEELAADVRLLDGFPIVATQHYNLGMGLLVKKTEYTSEQKIVACVVQSLREFESGAQTGCVPSIRMHCEGRVNQSPDEQPEFLEDIFPWMLEGAIRGHGHVIQQLMDACFKTPRLDSPEKMTDFILNKESRSYDVVGAAALSDYWGVIHESTFPLYKQRHIVAAAMGCTSQDANEELRQKIRNAANMRCCVCSLSSDGNDNDGITLMKCSRCNFYSYCSQECQQHHADHSGECKQLGILMEYHRPHHEHIRDALQAGTDPQAIPALQTLRTKLGLNRPENDYGKPPADAKQNINVRKDGTVIIGSSPNAI